MAEGPGFSRPRDPLAAGERGALQPLHRPPCLPEASWLCGRERRASVLIIVTPSTVGGRTYASANEWVWTESGMLMHGALRGHGKEYRTTHAAEGVWKAPCSVTGVTIPSMRDVHIRRDRRYVCASEAGLRGEGPGSARCYLKLNGGAGCTAQWICPKALY